MKDMAVVIDRFEGQTAVCERPDRTMLSLPRSGLPSEAREGDVIIISKGAVRIDRSATAARKKAAEEKLRQIMKNP
jgi:hypothetical protein